MFHQLLARSLEAPTEAITALFQEGIIVWLKYVEEQRAAAWFEKTWTIEHGTTPMHLPAMQVPTLLRAQRLIGNTLGVRRSEMPEQA